MAAAPVARRSLGQLFKKACDEIPEVVGATAGGILGTLISIYAVNLYYKKGLDNRRFKMIPVVVRPDDPRAKNLRTD